MRKSKKSKIDDVYNQCDTMDHDEVIRLQREYRKILNLIEEILGDDLSTTRYKNKNDFYSIFYLFFDLIFKKNYRIDVNSYSSIKKTLIKMSLEVKDSTTNKEMLDYMGKDEHVIILNHGFKQTKIAPTGSQMIVKNIKLFQKEH